MNHEISINPRNLIKAFTSSSINYHYGPIMVEIVNLYVIWYGTWTTNQKAIICDFLNIIGGFSWYGTTTLYQIVNGFLTYVSPKVSCIKSVSDNYSQGTQITNSELIVQSQLTINNALPYDKNGIYFVMSSADVNEKMGNSAFCKDYCAYYLYQW